MVGATRIVVVQEQAGNDALGGGDNYESQEIEFISATRAALGADTAFVIGSSTSNGTRAARRVATRFVML